MDNQPWARIIHYKALDHNILVVATTRIENKWKAYIKCVPGKNHDDEWEEVLKHGSEIDEKIARILFPQFKEMEYAE